MRVILILLILGGGVYFSGLLPAGVDLIQNRVVGHEHGGIPELHRELRVVDLHADTLLWARSLLERGSRGHVDLMRLQEGNIGLQVFSVVTKSPRWISYQGNSVNDGDNITLLATSQRWPMKTWNSLLERALHQARRLREAAADSKGRLRMIREGGDLEKLLEDRKVDPGLTGALLLLEGSHALEGRLENLGKLHEAGFRVLAPSHMFDSEISGSQQGEKRGGLTPLGRLWVTEMNRLGLIIDLAHASSATIDDVLELSKKPVMVSHTGVEKLCQNNRNLSDDQIRGIASRGGMIGVGLWSGATCGTDLRSVVKTIRHVIAIGGLRSVSLGSDWDGFVSTPVDAAKIGRLTQALVDDHFAPDEIRAVMGENAIRFFLENLPSRNETKLIE